MNLERAMQFLQSGTVQPGTLEYKWWEYYDTIVLATATLRHQFFAVPEGQGGKTRSRTNWQVANQMPESERMAVMFFSFAYLPKEARTQAEYIQILDLLKNSYFQFTVYNKAPQIVIPLTTAFSVSMPLLVSGAAAGDQVFSRNELRGMYEIGIEIPLAAKTTVKAEIVIDVAGNTNLDDDQIKFSMIGPLWAMG